MNLLLGTAVGGNDITSREILIHTLQSTAIRTASVKDNHWTYLRKESLQGCNHASSMQKEDQIHLFGFEYPVE